MLKSLIDVPIDVFGGYCPAIVPANLPPGAANIAQDVCFPMAGVRTRGGLGTGVLSLGNAASINGMKSFLPSAGGRDLMIWDSLGNLFKEDPQGTINLINARGYANLFYESQSLFSREYQAFFNGLGGFDIPRQYDDKNWDRVSQVGPGLAPVASDISWPLLSISRAATTGIITGVLDVPWGQAPSLVPGGLITIVGLTADTTLDGTFPVTGVGPSGGGDTQFTAWGNPGSYTISAISRAAIGGGLSLVTATLSGPPSVSHGDIVVVAGVDDESFNGSWVADTLSGNTLTWIDDGPNSISAGGFLYIQNFVGSLYDASPGVPGNYPTGTAGIALVGDLADELPPGITITLAGGSNADWNTSWVTSGVNPPTYLPPGSPGLVGQGAQQGITQVYLDAGAASYPAAQSYGGTATLALNASSPAVSGVAGPAGNISQGLHLVSVAFITRQGFITQAAPWSQWNAQGGLQAALTGIATGPPNIQQRLLLFTPMISPPAVTGTFCSLPTGSTALSKASVMLIPDNTTTTATIDFSDAILISGFQAEYLFSQLELGECSTFLPYNARGVWLGERNKVPNFVNLEFDGGFTATLPDGWTLDPVSGAGGQSALSVNIPGDWADAYAITGDGATVQRGLIRQSAYQDALLVARIEPNTSYSLRVRVMTSGVITQGVFKINLRSLLAGITTTGIVVDTPANHQLLNFEVPANGRYYEFIASLTDVPFAIVPSDLQLQVYSDGTLSNGGTFIVDSIQIFPTLTPVNASTARISRGFNPESFDSVTGQVQVRPGDGQQLRAGFPLRNSLYLAKDHYLGYVTDDGVNEPSSWQFTEVDATTGICGPNAVDWTNEWAVFAERSGLHLCWGSDPVKITPEIQNDATNTGRVSWASINWTAAYTMWVRIDRVNKMILVGAPINGATSPNVVFMLDYRWLDSAEDIASSPLVGYSQFTGKILGHGRGRRWAVWNIAANAMCFAERADGSVQPFFGGIGNGTVFWQQDFLIQGSDNGAAIASQYQGYATPSSIEEQQYQLRAHRKLLGYLKFRAVGVGTLNLAVSTAERSTILRGYALSLNPSGDGERPVNVHGERFFLTCSTNAVGAGFQLEKWIPCLRKDAAALVRGVSS